jgi:8-oxo-dGTP pyrophosphatase MutT (NUDIX family)
MCPLQALQRAIEDEELRALEKQWGRQPVQRVTLDVGDPFLTGEHQLLLSDERRAEICYIMHRGDPADGLLLHTKTIYPPGAYRLQTGGIQPGQGVMDTLAREIAEETGLTVGEGAAQVRVERMLGVVAYDFIHRELQRSFAFATYHFLVQMPRDAELNPQDSSEQIGGWQWQPPAEFRRVAQALRDVGRRLPYWRDWGRFRTVSHEFVAQRLDEGFGMKDEWG